MGGYDQLTLEERDILFRLHKAGMAVGQMAKRLGPHRLTICRELGRSRKADGAYLPGPAQRFACTQHLRGSKIEFGDHVGDQLATGWSPKPR